jgi:hypothetical protein
MILIIIIAAVLLYLGLFMDTVIVTVVGTVGYLLYKAWINGLLSPSMQAVVFLTGLILGIICICVLYRRIVDFIIDRYGIYFKKSTK